MTTRDRHRDPTTHHPPRPLRHPRSPPRRRPRRSPPRSRPRNRPHRHHRQRPRHRPPHRPDDLTRRNATVLDLIKTYGDAVEKLETGAFSITPELTKHGRGERIRAYHGRVHITAELTDFTALGELTTRLADLDLTRVDGPWWALRPDLTRPRRSPPQGRPRSRPARPRIRRSPRHPPRRPRRTRRHRRRERRPPRPTAAAPAADALRRLRRRRGRQEAAAPRPRTPAPDRLRPGQRPLHHDTPPALTNLHARGARQMLIGAAPAHNSTLVNNPSRKGC